MHQGRFISFNYPADIAARATTEQCSSTITSNATQSVSASSPMRVNMLQYTRKELHTELVDVMKLQRFRVGQVRLIVLVAI